LTSADAHEGGEKCFRIELKGQILLPSGKTDAKC